MRGRLKTGKGKWELVEFKKLRADFPILKRYVNGPSFAKASEGKKPLVYLDSAATSQKPRQVLAVMDEYYSKHNANVHRGIHTLSVEATEMYEGARRKVADFVGVKDPSEIVFVRNATEAINLVAYSWGRQNIKKGDEIVVTIAEHHSNFVPWQQLAFENGAVLKIIPIEKSGELDLVAFRKVITPKTKLVTFFHVSNVLGMINPVADLVKIARKANGKRQMAILVDGAQAIPHMPVDISKLGCDFYVFTGHKMLGPTGIGVLWGKREILELMPPFLFGGEMISKVSVQNSTWNELPWKFEAGTPNIAGAVGLGAAVDYLSKIGMDRVRKHEIELTKYAISELSKIAGVTTYGSNDAKKRGGVISFNVGSSRQARTINYSSSPSNSLGMNFAKRNREVSFIHAHDVASILDSEGVAIRSGHHCAQPLMDFLGISSAARASFYLYNTKEEVDRLVEGVMKVKETFKI